MKMVTQYKDRHWPFRDGQLTLASLKPVNIDKLEKLFIFPSKFPKMIDSTKKQPDFWMVLDTDHIQIKKAERGQITKWHTLQKEQFPHYSFNDINVLLQGNTSLCLKTSPLFHHL